MPSKVENLTGCLRLDKDVRNAEHFPFIHLAAANKEPPHIHTWVIFECIWEGRFQLHDLFETEGCEKRDKVWVEVEQKLFDVHGGHFIKPIRTRHAWDGIVS